MSVYFSLIWNFLLYYRNREVSFIGGPPLVKEKVEDIGDNSDETGNGNMTVEPGNSKITKSASNFVSESMLYIGDTVSRLSKSFSTEKPNTLNDDNIPLNSITPKTEPKKFGKSPLLSHRRSQSVTSFTKIQKSPSSTSIG